MIRFQGWRAEAALTPGYYLSPLRGEEKHGKDPLRPR